MNSTHVNIYQKLQTEKYVMPRFGSFESGVKNKQDLQPFTPRVSVSKLLVKPLKVFSDTKISIGYPESNADSKRHSHKQSDFSIRDR